MSSKKNGGPAFPRPIGNNGITHHEEHESSYAQEGMSLRDYFAAKSLPAVMMARALDPTNEMNQESIAEECYDLADALLLEREQPASTRRTE